tara:strand:+ start:284 stop:517 length:234 start_codon:yes stop_codon:yes gene_type:complete
MTKQAHYWQMQEDRWHQQYLAAEKLLDQLEVKIWEKSSRIETLEAALRKVSAINNKRDRFSSEIDGVVVEALGSDNV